MKYRRAIARMAVEPNHGQRPGERTSSVACYNRLSTQSASNPAKLSALLAPEVAKGLPRGHAGNAAQTHWPQCREDPTKGVSEE